MHFFDSMVAQLDTTSIPELSKTKKMVKKEDYEIFCNEFIFDSLRSVSFGEAFCKRFNISDNILPRMSDDGAKFIIEKVGYLE